MKIIKSNRRNFETIFNALDIDPQLFTKPMNDFHPILGLRLPYSRATCLILYLYSMELGSPQLYSEANRVARDMDLTHLRELGPFLKALGEITLNAEISKDKEDKMTPGVDISSDVSYNMSGSFLLFRGAPMKDEWV